MCVDELVRWRLLDWSSSQKAVILPFIVIIICTKGMTQRLLVLQDVEVVMVVYGKSCDLTWTPHQPEKKLSPPAAEMWWHQSSKIV